MSTLRILLATACAVLAALPASASAQAPLVPLSRATPVDAYDGYLLFSRFDGKAYRLAVWHDGGTRDLAAPSQSAPFDADLGPDSHGDPSAAYVRCHPGCDLYVISLRPGAAPRPVRNANTKEHDEIAPTIWRGRLAFARRYGPDQVIPYTKELVAPRSRPSDRLAGLPSRRCGAVDPPHCRPIAHVGTPKLELWGRWIAQVWRYQPEAFPGFAQDEVRLTDVRRTDTRQVAAMTSGLSGQTYLGRSIADGRVAWFRECQGDPGGCSAANSGAFRYRISTGAYDHAGADERWSGWAYDGATSFHVPSAYACGGGDPGTTVPPCGVVAEAPLAWTPIDADRVR